MFERTHRCLGRPGGPRSGGKPALLGAACAAVLTLFATVAPAASLNLGMAYVVPPHQPGAKVRTPEGMAPLLFEQLEKTFSVQAHTVATDGAAVQVADVPDDTTANAYLLPVDADGFKRSDAVVIPTGYRAGVMAIMRTDTDIRSWQDLRGRSVCLTEQGGLVGSMQDKHGAEEKVFRAPADALLDLRIGGCDAAVLDSTLLNALLEFPEWQKFSARLPILEERELAFVVPAFSSDLAQTLQAQVQQWQQNTLLQQLTEQAARDIAFEVYMDQEVPDCH